MAWLQAKEMAQAILEGFKLHYRLLNQVQARARERFEDGEWKRNQRIARDWISFYDTRVHASMVFLKRNFPIYPLNERLWQRIKVEYMRLLPDLRQPELAETFYNSVFCRLFERHYFNNDYIFVWPLMSTEYLHAQEVIYHSYYPRREGIARCFFRILRNAAFKSTFENLHRDVRLLVYKCDTELPTQPYLYQNLQLSVLRSPFFRGKAAYLIGCMTNGPVTIPFVIPILRKDDGELVVDALLIGNDAISNIFSFTRTYFMLDTQVPAAIVNFLKPLLPNKRKSELYTAIGLQKYGKADFYRDFLTHLLYSTDKLVEAPGIRGMVMCVFTLPSFPFVFKIIKDKFHPVKQITADMVKQKYHLVKHHDRVGRMADSWEYSFVAFPVARFDPEFLHYLLESCASNCTIEGDQLYIRHLYIERRLIPLDIYLRTANETKFRHAVIEYGNAIRQLAAVNIFPGDLLFKNFGVTRYNRVVFYDYDEIAYITECNFRHIPPAPCPEMEMSGEVWYGVGPNDVFPEEFRTFLLQNRKVREIFLAHHADLLTPEWWQALKDRISSGQIENLFPYADSDRFYHFYSTHSKHAELTEIS